MAIQVIFSNPSSDIPDFHDWIKTIDMEFLSLYPELQQYSLEEIIQKDIEAITDPGNGYVDSYTETTENAEQNVTIWESLESLQNSHNISQNRHIDLNGKGRISFNIDSVTVIGEDTNFLSSIQIGDTIKPTLLTNLVGVIFATTNSNIVTGKNTSFQNYNVGQILGMLEDPRNYETRKRVGVIKSIISNTELYLENNSLISCTGKNYIVADSKVGIVNKIISDTELELTDYALSSGEKFVYSVIKKPTVYAYLSDLYRKTFNIKESKTIIKEI